MWALRKESKLENNHHPLRGNVFCNGLSLSPEEFAAVRENIRDFQSLPLGALDKGSLNIAGMSFSVDPRRALANPKSVKTLIIVCKKIIITRHYHSFRTLTHCPEKRDCLTCPLTPKT